MAYGAALSAAEVVALKVSDIDSKRMLIRGGQGTGGKDGDDCDAPARNQGERREIGV